MGIFNKKEKTEDDLIKADEYKYVNNIDGSRDDIPYYRFNLPCIKHKVKVSSFNFREGSDRGYADTYDFEHTKYEEEYKILPYSKREPKAEDYITYNDLRNIFSKLIDLATQLDWGANIDKVNDLEEYMRSNNETYVCSSDFKFNKILTFYKYELYENIDIHTVKDAFKPLIHIITEATPEQMSGWVYPVENGFEKYEPTGDLIDFNIAFNGVDLSDESYMDAIIKANDHMCAALDNKNIVRSKLLERFDIEK